MPQPPCPSTVVSSALAALERIAADNTTAYARGDPAVLDRARNSAANAIGRFDRDGAGDAEPQTVFHSSAVPTFGLARFVTPLRRCKDASAATGVGCLAAAVTGDDDFESVAMMGVALVLRHGDATGLPLTSHMLHRLFLAALLVAAKAHHDVPPSTPGFARATGMDAAEMGRLEAALCVQLDWRIVVDRADIARVLDRIRRAEEALSTEPSTPRAQSGHGDAPTSLAPAAVECFVTVFDASGEQPEPRQAPTSRTHGGLVSMFAESFGTDRGMLLSSFTRDCVGAASSTLLASVDAYLAANDVGVASHAKAQEFATLDDSMLTAFSPAAGGNDYDAW